MSPKLWGVSTIDTSQRRSVPPGLPGVAALAGRVARRDLLARAARVLGLALLIGSVAAVVAVTVLWWLRVPTPIGLVPAIAVGASALVGSALTASVRTGRVSLLRTVDERLKLEDRLLNGVALAGEENGYAQLAVRHAERAASGADATVAIPVRFARAWAIWPVLTAIAVAGWWLPARAAPEGSDPTPGVLPGPEPIDEAEARERLEDLRADPVVQDAASPEDLALLDDIERELEEGLHSPEEATERAARVLDEAAERLDPSAGGAGEEQSAGKSPSGDAPAEEQAPATPMDEAERFAEALRESDFDTARDAAEDLLNSADRLSPEEREALARRLDELADAAEAEAPESGAQDVLRDAADAVDETPPGDTAEPVPPQPDSADTPTDTPADAPTDTPAGGNEPQPQDQREQQAEDQGSERPADQPRDGSPSAEEQPSDQTGERPSDAPGEQQQRPGGEGEQQQPGTEQRPEGGPQQQPGEQPQEQPQQQPGGQEGQPQDQPAAQQDGESPGDPQEPQQGEQPGEQQGEQQPGEQQPGQQPNPQLDQPAGEQPDGAAPTGEQPSRQQGEREASQPDGQPGEQPGERPGGQEGEGQPQRQAEGPAEGQAERQGERQGVREAIDQLEADRQQRARRLRERASDLMRPGPGEPGDPDQRDGLGPGDQDATQRLPTQPDSAGPPSFDPLDARPEDVGEGARESVVGEWFNDRPGEAGGGTAGPSASERLRDAARGAERAVEDQAVPRRYRDLVRDVFRRLEEQGPPARAPEGEG